MNLLLVRNTTRSKSSILHEKKRSDMRWLLQLLGHLCLLQSVTRKCMPCPPCILRLKQDSSISSLVWDFNGVQMNRILMIYVGVLLLLTAEWEVSSCSIIANTYTHTHKHVLETVSLPRTHSAQRGARREKTKNLRQSELNKKYNTEAYIISTQSYW